MDHKYRYTSEIDIIPIKIDIFFRKVFLDTIKVYMELYRISWSLTVFLQTLYFYRIFVQISLELLKTTLVDSLKNFFKTVTFSRDLKDIK